MNVNELVGKRCLLQLGGTSQWQRKEVTEYRVLEVSPSGNWVKMMNLFGNKFWRPVAEVALIEILVELKAERPPNA